MTKKKTNQNLFYQTFKEAYQIWEKPAGEFWMAYLSSPLFLETLGQGLTLSLSYQRMAKAAAIGFWRAWGLPDTDTQDKTLHKLNEIESRIDRLSEQMAHIADQTNPEKE